MPKLVNNTSLSIRKKQDFLFDFYNLNNFYRPIIGNVAMQLYINLLSEAINYQKIGGQMLLEQFVERYQLTYEEFHAARKKIEAIALIDTYYDEREQAYHIIVNPVEQYQTFIELPQYKSLLTNKIGVDGIERLNYLYNAQPYIEGGAVAISQPLTYLVDQINNNDVRFNEIYQKIAQIHQNQLIISDDCKKIIEENCNHFTTNEILTFLNNSVIYANNGQVFIDQAILIEKIRLHLLTSTKIKANLQVYRNHAIFEKKASEAEIQKVFASYHLNCEQYLYSITKTNLAEHDLELISQLRHKQLTDAQINMLIDFTFFKSKIGRLSHSFIKPTAQTVLNMNLNTLDKMLSY
jgi:replication initiation and membrane attachment protein DnaB